MSSASQPFQVARNHFSPAARAGSTDNRATVTPGGSQSKSTWSRLLVRRHLLTRKQQPRKVADFIADAFFSRSSHSGLPLPAFWFIYGRRATFSDRVINCLPGDGGGGRPRGIYMPAHRLTDDITDSKGHAVRERAVCQRADMSPR